jgi:hypothetical protein
MLRCVAGGALERVELRVRQARARLRMPEVHYRLCVVILTLFRHVSLSTDQHHLAIFAGTSNAYTEQRRPQNKQP